MEKEVILAENERRYIKSKKVCHDFFLLLENIILTN